MTVTLAEAFEGIADVIGLSEAAYDSHDTQTNRQRGSVELNQAGKIYPVSDTDPAIAWFEQASAQHDHNHYLDFLGASPVSCTTTGADADFTRS